MDARETRGAMRVIAWALKAGARREWVCARIFDITDGTPERRREAVEALVKAAGPVGRLRKSED